MPTFDEIIKDYLGNEKSPSGTLSPDMEKKLSSASHYDMLKLRGQLPDNHPLQNVLGRFEHQAFAKEYVKKNPISGSISMAGAIPLYTLSKTLKTSRGRSSPSLSEIGAGYKGIYQGLTE